MHCSVGALYLRAVKRSIGNSSGNSGVVVFRICQSGGDALELYAQVRSMNEYNAALELLRHFPPN
jgi:hypothetical protein